jgi:hypothetical protein
LEQWTIPCADYKGPFTLIEGIEEKIMADRLTLRFDQTLLPAVDRLAEKTRRSRDWRVSRAIQD